MGLYLAVDVGDQHELPDAISLEPLLIDGGLVGANLGFKEVRFPIWFTAAPLNNFSLEIDGKKFGSGGVELIHHLRAWRFTIGKLLLKMNCSTASALSLKAESPALFAIHFNTNSVRRRGSKKSKLSAWTKRMRLI